MRGEAIDTVVAVVNDLHCGSPFALAPARWRFPTGTPFYPNELQTMILDHWQTSWQKIAALRRRKRLVVIVLGDVVEGVHHGSTQIETARIDVHEQWAVAVIETGLKLAKFRLSGGDMIYFVEGTNVHDGQSMERVARDVLDLDAQDATRGARDVLRLDINGVRFDATHKPGSGPGKRAHTVGNTFAMWLKTLYHTALEEGKVPPRYVLTAHHHVFLRRDVYTTQGKRVMTGYICPSWKLKDEFVYTVAPFNLSNIGMLAFEVSKDGAVVEHDDMHITIEQDEVEVI